MPTSPAPVRVLLAGEQIDHPRFDNPYLAEYFRVEQAYDLRPDKRGAKDINEVGLDQQIVALDTDDGVTWIGYVDDLPEIVGEPGSIRRNPTEGKPDTFRLPSTFSGDRTRGLFGTIANKLFRVIIRADHGPTERIAAALGLRLDEKACPAEGLYRLQRNGRLAEDGRVAAPGDILTTEGTTLIMIHGTASSFDGGYGGIDADTWGKLHDRYQGRVYALNHYTITKSPVANAIELLRVLPKGLQVDLVTHSRGGLVGDVLARCDARIPLAERGYTAAERHKVSLDFDGPRGRSADIAGGIVAEMAQVTALAADAGLTVRRIIRVACPAAGTMLLSRRLDHYLNALFNLLKLASAPLPALVAVTQVLEAFVVAVASERADPRTFPGLYAMVPEGAFADINNTSAVRLPSTLISVAGDSEVGGGVKQSLAVILTNLYYRDPNDFVVDTASMSRGIAARAGNYVVLLRNTAVDHFRYFSVADHLKIVFELLTVGAPVEAVLPRGIVIRDLSRPTEGRRGVVIDKLYAPGELYSPVLRRDRPIVVLLPGIMGSHLYVDNEHKWVDLSAMINGALVDDLASGKKTVVAGSVLDEFYGDLVRYLYEQNQSVCVFPYDWRLPLATSAALLSDQLETLRGIGQPIRLLAHSMGGLVVRQYMFDFRDNWVRLRDTASARVVYLGTPWRGSHLVTEVLTGHSARVRQLYRLDLRHDRRTLLETVQGFAGLLELLPLDEPTLDDADNWTALAEASGTLWWKVPALSAAAQAHFRAYKASVDTSLKLLTEADYAAMVYVAGEAPATVDGYEFVEKRRFGGKVLRYTSTALGDGSVTWLRGIPKGVADENLYYVETAHGLLAADRSLFRGLLDLLQRGETQELGAFAKTPHHGSMGSRRGVGVAAERQAVVGVPQLAAVSPMDALFGITPQPTEAPQESIAVEVFNGDLKWARFPVLVGHFKQFGLVSAERAVDRHLGDVLTERYKMGFYPGEIGDQEVIIDDSRRPRGAIVVGLGSKDELTGSQLALTVRRGLVKYAMFRRDNRLDEAADADGRSLGVSMVLVGTNFGELPLRECLRNLLAGVRAANADIENFARVEGKARLCPIRRVEFVDYYEDRAYQAFRTLQDIVERESLTDIVLAERLVPGFGRRRRFLRAEERGWWQTLATRTETFDPAGAVVETPAPGFGESRPATRPTHLQRLRFDTYTRGASVSSELVYSNLTLARLMAKRMSQGSQAGFSTDNARASKVLFELLIPNAYKDFIRNYRNIVWQMDAESAAFPWELFHDEDTGPIPTFVGAGMIRQLYSKQAPLRPAFVRQETALVIADPLLRDITSGTFGQLAGAVREGQLVADRLRASRYELVEHLEHQPADEIVAALFERAYKVVHIAAHGIFRDFVNGSGVVLSDDVLLSPGMFRQLSSVPEFVFINCCHLGQVDAAAEDYIESRYQLAANIGTQLIQLGVRAVVVAGWAVDDGPAAEWAEVFYDEMLGGSYFGDAVRLARKRCYDRYPNSNTWGAYQCYGDQFYRLPATGAVGHEEDLSVDIDAEVVLELDNLISRARATAYADREWLVASSTRASRMLTRLRDLGPVGAPVLERKAIFELYTGNYPASIKTYEKLFREKSGKYELQSYFTYTNLRARQYTIEALKGTISKPKAFAKISKLLGRLTDIARLADEDARQGREPDPGPKTRKTRMLLGPSLRAERGSVHKRLAVVAETREEVLKQMRLAAKEYLRAAHEVTLNSRESIYHVCSYLQVAILYTSPKSVGEDLGKQLGERPEAFFKRWIHEESYLADERDSPYAALRPSNLLLTETIWKLVSDGPTDLKRAADALIRLHEQQLDAGFNLRDLRGQIENYDIIVCLGERLGVININDEELTQLQRVRKFLHSRLVFPADGWRADTEAPQRCLRDAEPAASPPTTKAVAKGGPKGSNNSGKGSNSNSEGGSAGDVT